MKRILIAGALALAAGGQALAADLPQPAPPPPRAPATYVPAPVPVFSWTGIYVGINGGYAFGDSNWTSPHLRCSPVDRQLQHQRLARRRHDRRQLPVGPVRARHRGRWRLVEPHWHHQLRAGARGCTTQSDWLATVRGRAGYAFDRFLVYGTGGAAFGDLQAAFGALPFSNSTQTGWTAGAGVEFAFTPNLTAKVEYLYVDLGSQSCPAGSCVGAPLPTSRSPRTLSAPASTTSSGDRFRF